jgi:DNA-binding GntR family transcriptional regulator
VPEYIVTKLDLVEQLLIRSIASGEIAPGEPLRQLELADRLGISATPVREALRRLEAQGLVVRHPHRGVRVAEVEPGEMAELYIIRAALEGLAVEHAAPHLTAKDLRVLEQIHERLEVGRAKGALKSLRKLNYDFHTTLYQHSGLPRLIRIIDSLWPLFPWDSIWAIPGRAASSAAEHREILDALQKGDAVAAGSAMRRHIESGAEELIKFHANADQSSGQSSGRRSTKQDGASQSGNVARTHARISNSRKDALQTRTPRTAATKRKATTARQKADPTADPSIGAGAGQVSGGPRQDDDSGTAVS